MTNWLGDRCPACGESRKAFYHGACYTCEYCGQLAHGPCDCLGKDEKRKLNELVDLHVMEVGTCRENHAQSSSWCMSCPGDTRKEGFTPPYCTEFYAALEVVERLHRKWNITIDWPRHPSGTGWFGEAPRAICLAALEARGHKVEVKEIKK
jgi:hypothetical protein